MRWWPARKRSAAQPNPPQTSIVRSLIGAAHVVDDSVNTTNYHPGDTDQELNRLIEAVREVDIFLTNLGLDTEFSEVFTTQNAILHDLTWLRAATHAITKGADAPTAVIQAFSDISALFDSIPNTVLRERGTDVRCMSRLVRSALVGTDLLRREPLTPSVWVLDELDAPTAMQLTPKSCLGVITYRDLISGHGVEIANSRGFIVITGLAPTRKFTEGELIQVQV